MDRSRLIAFLVSLLAAMAACAPAFAQALVIGGKDFTEQRLIAEMTSQLLRTKGYTITTRTGFATGGIRREQEAGLVDLYWEYTGTSLVMFNQVEAYNRVRELDASKGLIWLTPSKVDKYCETTERFSRVICSRPL